MKSTDELEKEIDEHQKLEKCQMSDVDCRVIKNGKEIITVTENGVVKSVTINGVPQKVGKK